MDKFGKMHYKNTVKDFEFDRWKGRFCMRLVITVVGKDQVGIIARVSQILSDAKVNILDISQTILQDKFTMMMYVDMDESFIHLADLKKKLQDVEDKMRLAVQIYSEEIFNYMHRI